MARSSPYGDLLQGMPGMKLPDWVFGGDFGDIENDIIKTEFGRRQSEARALQNDQLELDLNKDRRNQDFQEGLAGIFQEKKPATMRDMYQVGVEQALGQGRADIALQMQDKLDELDRREKQQRLQDTQLALSIGRMNPDEAARMNPQIFSPDVVARMKKEAELEMARAARLAKDSPESSRQPVAYNKDGKIEWVDPRNTTRRNELITDGWNKGEKPKAQLTDAQRLEQMLMGMGLQGGAVPQTKLPPGAVVVPVKKQAGEITNERARKNAGK